MSKTSELDQLTPEIYLQNLEERIDAGEESRDVLGMVHVKVERVQYSEKGERLSRPEVNIHSVSAWGVSPDKGMQDYYRRMGYDVEVLYDPRKKKSGVKTGAAIDPENVEHEAKKGRKTKGE